MIGSSISRSISAPGDLDTSFNPLLDGFVFANGIAVQPEGKILIKGAFTTVNGVSQNGIARLYADGSLDDSFVPVAGTLYFHDPRVAVQPDGKLVTTIAIGWPGFVVRLLSDGSLDPSFTPFEGDGEGNYDVALLNNGKILVKDIWGIRRLNSDGTLDESYVVGAFQWITFVEVQVDGSVLVGGAPAGSSGMRINDGAGNSVTRYGIARLNSEGYLDPSFDAGQVIYDGDVRTAVVQANGKVLMGGRFNIQLGAYSFSGPFDRRYLARLNRDGTLDPTFVPEEIDSYVGSIALQSNGKVIIGGGFTSVGGMVRTYIARLAGDPTIESLVPDRATAGAGDIAVAVHGASFNPADAKVLFGHPGSQMELTPNPVTSTSARLDIVIPEDLLVVAGDFTAYPITVRGPTGELSLPAAFTVLAASVANRIDELQTVVVTSGATSTVAIPPTSESDGGISATLTVSGEEPATVTVATYTSDPSESGNTSFEVAGQFLDLNASGVTEADSMLVYFYFPAGTPTETLSLKFWNTRVSPAAWENVTPTTIDPVLHRIEVVFDANSHPKITELDGTFFAPAVPPTIHFTGFLSPIGGADATGGSFAAPLKTFKSGSTIPVKFTATFTGAPLTTGDHRLQAVKHSDSTTAGTPIDATPQDAATTGNQFRFSDGNWQFNLDTRSSGITKGVWQLTATLSDDSQHTVWIQIK